MELIVWGCVRVADLGKLMFGEVDWGECCEEWGDSGYEERCSSYCLNSYGSSPEDCKLALLLLLAIDPDWSDAGKIAWNFGFCGIWRDETEK